MMRIGKYRARRQKRGLKLVSGIRDQLPVLDVYGSGRVGFSGFVLDKSREFLCADFCFVFG